MNTSLRDAAHWCVLRATAGCGCIYNTCSRDPIHRWFYSFFIGFGAVWFEMKSPVPSIKRKVSSYSEQKVVRAETRRSSHDTFPPSLLLIWAGQSEHPPRSSVNHITLNHTCWAPGCRLQIHQRSETTLSVAGAVVSIGQKMSWLYRDSQTSDATSVT